jgi:hypothetical protein
MGPGGEKKTKRNFKKGLTNKTGPAIIQTESKRKTKKKRR